MCTHVNDQNFITKLDSELKLTCRSTVRLRWHKLRKNTSNSKNSRNFQLSSKEVFHQPLISFLPIRYISHSYLPWRNTVDIFMETDCNGVSQK